MGNGVRECGWRHAPETRGGFGGFWNSQLEKRVCFRLLAEARSEAFVAGAARDGGGRWKSQNRKNVYLFPYVVEPFKLKGYKKFRTWTEKS